MAATGAWTWVQIFSTYIKAGCICLGKEPYSSLAYWPSQSVSFKLMKTTTTTTISKRTNKMESTKGTYKMANSGLHIHMHTYVYIPAHTATHTHKQAPICYATHRQETETPQRKEREREKREGGGEEGRESYWLPVPSPILSPFSALCPACQSNLSGTRSYIVVVWLLHAP